MNTFTKKYFLFFLLIPAFAGCKLDAPIYPDDSETPIGNSITYSINGGPTETVTANVGFTATAGGSLTIVGGPDTDGFLLKTTLSDTGIDDATTGTYDIGIITIGDLFGNGVGTISLNTFNLTDNTTGTITGTFTGQLNEPDSESEDAIPFTGTFSIKQ